MEQQNEQLITVTGKASTQVAPEITRLTISISSKRDTYAELYQLTSDNIREIGNIVEKQGLSRKLPKTISFNLEKNEVPKYDNKHNRIGYEQKGFVFKQHIQLDLGMDVSLVSSVIWQIGKLLPDAEISIDYTIKDTRTIELQLLEKAILDAHEQAKIMATAAGCKLGSVKLIGNPNIAFNHIRQLKISKAISDRECYSIDKYLEEPKLDFNPDDVEFKQSVNVTWYLKDANA